MDRHNSKSEVLPGGLTPTGFTNLSGERSLIGPSLD
jgi:hypothetical protein